MTAESYDALRASVLEYAPVALNDIVDFFSPKVDDTRIVRRLGRLGVDFILSGRFGDVPTALPTDFSVEIANFAVLFADHDPADTADAIHQAFVLAGEYAVRRADAAARIDHDALLHFGVVLRALERLVVDLVVEVVRDERTRVRGRDPVAEAATLNALLDDPARAVAAAPRWMREPATSITMVVIRSSGDDRPPAPDDLPTPCLVSLGDVETIVALPSSRLETVMPELRRTFAGSVLAVGVPVLAAGLGSSVEWCRRALVLNEGGMLADSDGVIRCSENLTALVAGADGALVRLVTDELLAPFRDMNEYRREILLETLGVWVRRPDAGVPALAAELGRHPQTVRYRMRQLRLLMGDALDDEQTVLLLRLAFLLRLA